MNSILNTSQQPPPGFEPLQRGGPFFASLGPVYGKRRDDGQLILGLFVNEQHTNVQGMAHGGMLATLADSALGIAVRIAANERPMVTVNLSTDFVHPARPGDWIEVHVDIQRVGARLAFANCYLTVGERRILRASGVFASIG